MKVLLDYETIEDVKRKKEEDKEFELPNHLRYSMINSTLCIGANVTRNAKGKKKCCGSKAYDI